MAGADSNDIDEDQAVLRAFQDLVPLHPKLLLILVPRKPERFEAAEQRLRAAGVQYIRRSQYTSDATAQLPCVLLLDSMGELASLFPLVDIVFMGGSLARRGGHNLLEPAASARPIIAGPHLENFAAIAAEFRKERAMLEIKNAGELTAAVERLIGDPGLRQNLGARAATLAAKQAWRNAKSSGTDPASGTIARFPARLEAASPDRCYGSCPKSGRRQAVGRFAGTAALARASRHAGGQHWRPQHGRNRKNPDGGLPGGASPRERSSTGHSDPRIRAAVDCREHPGEGRRTSARRSDRR